MGKIEVKIKKPIKGWGYHGGEVAELPSETAKKLIDGGYAILVPDTDGKENPLPKDLPARELLFENGFEDLKSILNAKEALTDIEGIGETTLKNILEYIEKQN